MTLGERLRKARKHAGITQPQLAEISGVAQQTISKIERGVQQSSTEIVSLAGACGVRPEWLDKGIGPMEAPKANEEAPAYGAKEDEELKMYLDVIEAVDEMLEAENIVVTPAEKRAKVEQVIKQIRNEKDRERALEGLRVWIRLLFT